MADTSPADSRPPGPFEEMFTILDGEIEFTFRGVPVATAGETINMPASAPHVFRNASGRRRDCCSVLARGPGGVLREVGVLVAHRTEAPPALDEAATAAFIAKSVALAPKYRTELLLRPRNPDPPLQIQASAPSARCPCDVPAARRLPADPSRAIGVMLLSWFAVP